MSSLEITPDTCSHFSNDLIGVLKSADTYASALLLGIVTQRSPGTINSIVTQSDFGKDRLYTYIRWGYNINSRMPSLGLALYTRVMTSFFSVLLLQVANTCSQVHIYDTKRFPLPYYEIHARFRRTCLTELRVFFLRLNRLGCSAAALLSKWSPDKREAEISLSISLLANSEHNESWHYPRAPVKCVGGQLQW